MPWRSWLKSALVTGYCHRLIPFAVVAWAFRHIDLRGA